MTALPTRRPGPAAALLLLLVAPAVALFLGVAGGAVPAAAQPPADAAAPAEEEGPADPAVRAPQPADLSGRPAPARPAQLPDLVLSPDFTRLPAGGWRMAARGGRGRADPGNRAAMETVGRYLAEQTTGRVNIVAQVAGPADDPSVARRTSLANAIAAKTALVAAGLPGTRIDIHPMGLTPEGTEAVDIIAPPAPRVVAQVQTPAPAAPQPAAGTSRPAAPARAQRGG